MRHAVFLGGGRIMVETAERPTPGPEEVLLRVHFTALCGSDNRLYYRGAKVTPGHEIVGVVEEAGAGAAVSLGCRAAVYIPRFCGQCRFCLAGETNRCDRLEGLIGWGDVPGGFAEYVAVPARNLLALPPDIGDDLGVLLLDTIGTTAHGIRLCQQALSSAARSDRAAVVGCGPLGLGALLVLQAMGWGMVGAIDPADRRRDFAVELGGHAFDPADQRLAGTCAVVVEASGKPAARAVAMSLAEAGGAVLLLGESDDPWTITPSVALRRRDCAYVRSFYFPIGDLAENLELLRSRRARFQRLLGPIVPLNHLSETYADFIAGKTIKPLITPNG
ncbi:MAG: alcohol dehydrogenase catalytic domain-containing protein [Chloroflexota bacterium]